MATKKQTAPKTKTDLRKYSLSEFCRTEVVPATLEAGFRVWMKLERKEPLRGRSMEEWNRIMTTYKTGGKK